jgi:hypothetical protein
MFGTDRRRPAALDIRDYESMTDILLNFVNAYDNQGCVVKVKISRLRITTSGHGSSLIWQGASLLIKLSRHS